MIIYPVTHIRISRPDGTREVIEGPVAVEMWESDQRYYVFGGDPERQRMNSEQDGQP